MADGTTEQNKQIVRRYFQQVWNEGNMDIIEQLIAPTMVVHNAISHTFGTGTEVIRRLASMFRTAFPGMKYVIEDMVAEGDTVATRLTARTDGDAQGAQEHAKGMIFMRVRDGQIVESWDMWENPGSPPRA